MNLTSRSCAPWVALAGAALLATVLSGCTGSDAPAVSTGSGGSAAAAAQERTADSGAYVDDYDPEKVLLETDFPRSSDAEDVTTIGVESLVVDGETMTLRLVVTPTFPSAGDTEPVTFLEAVNDTFRPALVDRTNLKEYSIIGDQTGVGFKTDMHAEVRNGGSALAWFVFAAPEDVIDTIDLRVDSSWPEIRDVPITR